MVDRLERQVLLYADVVPISLKAEVMTISRVMPSECGQFLQIPHLKPSGRLKPNDIQNMFRFRFIGLMGMVKRAKQAFENAYEIATKEFEAATASRQESGGE